MTSSEIWISNFRFFLSFIWIQKIDWFETRVIHYGEIMVDIMSHGVWSLDCLKHNSIFRLIIKFTHFSVKQYVIILLLMWHFPWNNHYMELPEVTNHVNLLATSLSLYSSIFVLSIPSHLFYSISFFTMQCHLWIED